MFKTYHSIVWSAWYNIVWNAIDWSPLGENSPLRRRIELNGRLMILKKAWRSWMCSNQSGNGVNPYNVYSFMNLLTYLLKLFLCVVLKNRSLSSFSRWWTALQVEWTVDHRKDTDELPILRPTMLVGNRCFSLNDKLCKRWETNELQKR